MNSSVKKEFERLFANEMSEEEARDFLVALYEKGESPEEIAAAAEVMRAHSVKLPVPEDLRQKLIDVVGTGGDKSGSFNISTTVALLLAASGSYVAKHGNRSITSKSGSADVLDALGMRLDLSPEQQVMMLEETGFTFIFAIHHHPAMKHIMPIRRSLDHRTIFNILGPLTNPAGARKYLLGVFSPDYVCPIAKALLDLDVERAYVLSSEDGMDEISISAPTRFAYVEAEKVSEGVIEPEAHGFRRAPKEAILGGEAEENATILRRILSGEEQGPKREIVLLNGAYALSADGRVRDIQEAIEILSETIDSGKAAEHLEKTIRISNEL
ncbi:anthranilate phosphoribosyltransferase [Nitratifractor salsuginis]|uniref:Anthranilate phosphoribosyltransferase n=1 Tax=Nitratifractor salsuginis (strain DSM 16511 / JCM 12458 / E9I37-1) TaxID=749222 RepID=E6X255_NITSE|nr:anthranilate phosphoribosyltransferase [Nitratifractor salsuginis]ADV47124.1 anthranilate phosphoribosyltransferase [Nitratifractor salsuginis DSM 16511]